MAIIGPSLVEPPAGLHFCSYSLKLKFDGKPEVESVLLKLYRMTVNEIGTGRPIVCIPRLDIFTGLIDPKDALGRATQIEVKYETDKQNQFTVGRVLIVARNKETWQIYTDTIEVNLLVTAFIRILDEVNHLFIPEKQELEARHRITSDWLCFTGKGGCSVEQLKRLPVPDPPSLKPRSE